MNHAERGDMKGDDINHCTRNGSEELCGLSLKVKCEATEIRATLHVSLISLNGSKILNVQMGYPYS